MENLKIYASWDESNNYSAGRCAHNYFSNDAQQLYFSSGCGSGDDGKGVLMASSCGSSCGGGDDGKDSPKPSSCGA